MSKSGTRRKSRELALQMLFQLDMGKQTTDDVRKTFWSERKDLDEKVRGFADDLFRVASERERRSIRLSSATPSTGAWTAWPPSIAMCCGRGLQSSWDSRRRRGRS